MKFGELIFKMGEKVNSRNHLMTYKIFYFELGNLMLRNDDTW